MRTLTRGTLGWMILVLLLSSLIAQPVRADTPAQPAALEEDQPLTIVVIGTDYRKRSYLYGMGDTVMVFRVDVEEKRVDVMGFPRDLWVEIPDVEEDDGRTHGKLNQAYFFGTEGMGYYSGPGYGGGLMQATFKENWDFEVDHYLVINMQIFREVVDTLGGIEVYNPAPVYSFQQKNQPKFPAGGYYFMGKEALMYARWRDPRNSYDRVDRQSIVIQAICEKAFQLESIPKLPEIISSFRGNVLTDLNLAEISRLLYLAATLPEDQIHYTRIPKDELYWSGTVWLEKEPGTIQGIMDQFAAGEWPPPEAE